MILTTEQLELLIAQAREDAPNETCGIIAGKEGRALKIYALKNIDPDPRIRYNVDPIELLHALRETEDLGREHLAIYHSHPASPAYPSPTDIARAFYPDVVYVLISLMNPEVAMVRGFHIVEGKVEEITIEIEEKDESPRTNPGRAARPTRRPGAGRAVAPLSKRRPAGGKTSRARR
jgi:proteasome lid subunit RPN8/RPN11